MALSWNEIKHRAAQFSAEWAGEASEDAEAKSFWDGFFNVFGIPRRRVASFEQAVKKLDDRRGYIDLLWKGNLLIEHKSRGKDLDRAYKQARDYFPGLKDAELPKYILVSDFESFRLHDLDTDARYDFKLIELVANVQLFAFVAGYQKRSYKDEDPVNIRAAEVMGRLHDQLHEIGYDGHRLELYLVRLLFCLFADDTTIFEKGIFFDFIDQRTAEDGSDLARSLAELFEILNTPKERRLRNLDEQLAAFPYVNGKLFKEHLPTASFDGRMRQTLLDCSALDWGKISPAIFGSLFQSVMDEKARRNLGAHYTSEKNIMKLIRPLFLDGLWEEFRKVQSRPKMQAFHDRLRGPRFLDPACGCGNFLIIAYRELRLLELEVIKYLLADKLKAKQALTDINIYFQVDVDQFYGIEYEEFPAQIAQVAMWLIDHQMNMLASEQFGEYFVRLPLKKSATIAHGNALRLDWQSLLPEGVRYDYILGNPPFIGSKMMKQEQRDDIVRLFENLNGSGELDYVTGWYVLAAKYIQNSTIKVGFVSTNSITQGAQVGVLWGYLMNRLNARIHFAHRTFSWSNEAKGNAAVHVVIIGFASFDAEDKIIFEYAHIKGEPHQFKAKNINPYLVDAKDIFITKRNKPICNVPDLGKGNQPTDGGHLIIEDEELQDFLAKEPSAQKYIRKLIGSKEYIQNKPRWCLWLVEAPPGEIRKMPLVLERLEKVKEMRLASTDPATRILASTPSLFRETKNPKSFIAIPEVSSENRKYIPIGFLDDTVIPTNKLQIIPDATPWEFGILTSLMHMTWTRNICGRMKSDYQYSAGIVYNNFPWPQSPTDKQKAAVEVAAQQVLDARAHFPESSLADLYDPLSMPPALVKAHATLDKAVDLCYRPQPFPNEAKRMEYLFELYDVYTAGMFADSGKGKKGPKTIKP